MEHLNLQERVVYQLLGETLHTDTQATQILKKLKGMVRAVRKGRGEGKPKC